MAIHFGALAQISLLLLLVFWTTDSTGATYTFEEEFLQFKFQMENVVKSLHLKVTQLESKNVEMQEKVTELETRNAYLEIKIQEQENILNFLLLETNQFKPATGSKSISHNWKTAIRSRSGMPRTCRELREFDPSLPSGMQWIDPDGQGVGDSPIYVYCDMTTGSTAILHNSELPINVGHCADPGCYSRPINYNASMKQMESLIALSFECHQSITYDCNYAPLEFGNIPYAWWNDREGSAQYFWAGNNTGGIHTCQCGINKNCVDNSFKCNCDAGVPIQLTDDGVITDKTALPVTRLNFGRTQLATSVGIHTLGRLECTGIVALTGLPTSCEDLWLIGHTLNGFYSVMGSSMMEFVYCDFTKLPSDAEFEKWIGYADVKSAPVYFYVQRNSSFNSTATPIPFDLAVVNEGNAMDLTTGKFTAPRMGTYFFSFTGHAEFPASSSFRIVLSAFLYLNGDRIGYSYVCEANSVDNQFSPLTLQSTLKLKKGDQVWINLNSISTGVVLKDDGAHYTHFTGLLLEEEIVASL